MKTSKKNSTKKAAVKKVEKKKVGASFFFDNAQWKKVDSFLKKNDLTLNAWANQLIFSKLKSSL